MQDANISAHAVASGALWTLSAVTIGLELFSPTFEDVGFLGVVLGAAAGTLQIRGFLCERATEALRDAFEFGRETGRQECRPDASLYRVQ